MERPWSAGAQSLSFGALLKMHRSAAGLSQEELADRALLSAKTVGALEQGARKKPFPHTIANLCEALALSSSASNELRAAARGASPLGQTPESPPNNLPSQLSSFVGREQDVTAIGELLRNHRVVTLVGAAGIGKTRLALQAAKGSIVVSYDRVWFVDFGTLSDPSQVPETIATALGFRVSPITVETLCAALKHTRALVIFDNCEHVIDIVARVTEAALRLCPGVAILATSREPLKVAGEQIYRVPTLGVPERTEPDALQAERALRFDAVALFVDRAVAQDNRFRLTQELVPVVAEICRRLDGIALAIELAAARVGAFSPAALERSLRERFDLLVGSGRAAVQRHRTMTALVDWSYDFLNPDEQRLFRRLSICVDGFSLDGLAALCAQDDTIDRKEAFDLLGSLVEKSLVQKEMTEDGGVRYRLLESTREYALEKLRTSGEHEIAALAHARALLALAQPFDSVLELKPDRLWRNMTAVGVGNWRSALEWSLEHERDIRTGQELAASRAFREGQAPAETRRWIDIALQKCDENTPFSVRAKLELGAAVCAMALHQVRSSETLEAAQRALLYYQRADDRLGVAEAKACLGLCLVLRNEIAEGKRHLREALEAAQSHSAQWIIGFSQYALALAHYGEHDLGTARRMFREALKLCKAAECDRYAAQVAAGLAQTEYFLGNAETAVQLSRDAAQSLLINRRSVMFVTALSNCSAFLLALNRLDEARVDARQALIVARELAMPVQVAIALERLAAIATRRASNGGSDRDSSFRVAASMLGFVDARLRALEYERQQLEQRESDELTSALRDVFGSDLPDLMEEGTQWSEDRAIAEAFRL